MTLTTKRIMYRNILYDVPHLPKTGERQVPVGKLPAERESGPRPGAHARETCVCVLGAEALPAVSLETAGWQVRRGHLPRSAAAARAAGCRLRLRAPTGPPVREARMEDAETRRCHGSRVLAA